MVYVILWLLFALLVGMYASSKGHSGFGMFLVSVLLSPLIGFLIEAVRNPYAPAIEQAALATGGMKKCWACAELVKAEAVKCRYCGEALPAVNSQTAESAPTPEERAGW